ncbi:MULTISPECIES: hypothetical protein [Pantoea]|uniref:hypothetical protein n=1 Tax=Pantoea TaxID=53335 RepID=UPI00128FC697|nr:MULTISPECIES: hypothetical protein [Pantoea]MDI6958440.1 hypothetical protein [Pantoea sp. Pa-EAmG]
MRDKSRRYGLCDWTVQRSHPQMARLIVQISLPCDAAYNRTGGSGAIYCAMTFIKANIFTPVRMNAHPTMLYNLITDVHESIHRFTPVRMNAHPTVLCNLATDAHEYA